MLMLVLSCVVLSSSWHLVLLHGRLARLADTCLSVPVVLLRILKWLSRVLKKQPRVTPQ